MLAAIIPEQIYLVLTMGLVKIDLDNIFEWLPIGIGYLVNVHSVHSVIRGNTKYNTFITGDSEKHWSGPPRPRWRCAWRTICLRKARTRLFKAITRNRRRNELKNRVPFRKRCRVSSTTRLFFCRNTPRAQLLYETNIFLLSTRSRGFSFCTKM